MMTIVFQAWMEGETVRAIGFFLKIRYGVHNKCATTKSDFSDDF